MARVAFSAAMEVALRRKQPALKSLWSAIEAGDSVTCSILPVILPINLVAPHVSFDLRSLLDSVLWPTNQFHIQHVTDMVTVKHPHVSNTCGMHAAWLLSRAFHRSVPYKLTSMRNCTRGMVVKEGYAGAGLTVYAKFTKDEHRLRT